MARPKVMTIVGTRPEIIRLAAVVRKLEQHVDHVLVHTGQNYDYELNEVFFEDLELRRPDHFLGCGGGSLGETLGRILSGIEPILDAEMPDAVLILGDTNSSISAIMAKRKKVPVFHMEAGNRCFDQNVPEEINRRIVDHIADVNMAYSENARRYLLEERIARDRIFVTGSPMREVIEAQQDKIDASTALADLRLKPSDYFLVSAHREENIDNPKHLAILVATLNALAERYRSPVIVSTHPRTRKRLEAANYITHELVRFCKPFGFSDYVALQRGARCVISDSGTISEESAILGFPAVTIREAIERPEAIDEGSIIITGLDREHILSCIEVAMAGTHDVCPSAYWVRNTSDRVLRIILGYIQYINKRVWYKVPGATEESRDSNSE
jgi:UDP-N-acetylglucosamine 2-epimerase